jgi:hypothetical protein
MHFAQLNACDTNFGRPHFESRAGWWSSQLVGRTSAPTATNVAQYLIVKSFVKTYYGQSLAIARALQMIFSFTRGNLPIFVCQQMNMFIQAT